MKTLIYHPTGNANVRGVAKGLLEAGILGEFHTTIATFSKGSLGFLSKFGPFSELKRRAFDDSLRPFAKTWPIYEASRLFSLRAGFNKLTAHESGIFSIDSVLQHLDKQVASQLSKSFKKGIDSIYAYEDEALQTFKKSKKLGIKCYYDLPIGYWRTAQRLLTNESERWPEWSATLLGLQNSEAKLARKDEELSLADRIYVASTFTAKTLLDYPGKLAPVKVIPYGFPPVIKSKVYNSFAGNRPLKLLFVGGLSQRKGIADLFAAVERFGPAVELTVVGRKPVENCNALNTALTKYKWIPSLSHTDILKIMQANDVFIFPSLFEGFGLVITEAMSQGTPVITTDRTAGPDFITHGENGWITSAGSVDALFSTIEELLLNPTRIKAVAKAALVTAGLRPWSAYSSELIASLLNDDE